ncbi:carboxypeptidase-like regulatory domain-containing protein [Leeuwenhoekiella sp. MAR_2009_132]|uniref:carboxypeptidase-like regulatory domain-containing protein n=1 Tax=Leeuwenhoekiella sp. MAR_2009_132 TaxID=1392489 RepID=UPI00048E4572|nr:carboxypeptidase-like regulatory domain-containing protein [Leeuwenhoekiella sp. MAR_2009_132]
MKKYYISILNTKANWFIRFSLIVLCCTGVLSAQESQKYLEYKGTVISKTSENPLPFVNLLIEGTNIATVTNSEGNFSLKVEEAMPNAKVTLTYPGYEKLIIILKDLDQNKSVISLSPQAYELDEINISRPKNALTLVEQVFSNIENNYSDQENFMTAFYRETINKRNRSASLAEAVVTIQKTPYTNAGNDLIALYKARKSTNYDRLDTVAIKLQGGPLNALYADLVKYQKYFITRETLSDYDFSFGEPLVNDGNIVYVVNFKQKSSILEPLYYGKLYIDSKTSALTNALYNLNVENRKAASDLFVKKKPNQVKVYPTEISYRVDYRNKDGKWYYSYSNVQLEFVVNWKRKLFNSKYRINSEMLITDWETELQGKEGINRRSKFKENTVLADEVSGFADPEFWGAYNVIEPEKSIQQAIEKIQKQIKKE